jgi:hypothetical protein
MSHEYPIEVLLNGGATDYRFITADTPSEACEQALQDAKERGQQPAEAHLLWQDYAEQLEERVADLEACISEMLDVGGFEDAHGFTAVWESDLIAIAKHYGAD